MTLSHRSMCMIPHQGIGPPLSSLFIIKRPFCGAQGREWKEAYMFRIYCKVKNQIQWRKQVIQSDQGVHVCGIFWIELTPLSAGLYLLFWDMGYFVLPPPFFMLLGMDIFFSSFFLHSPYLFAWWIWRIMSKGRSIFVWMGGIFFA